MKLSLKKSRFSRGQGMTEYVAITTILLVGGLALMTGWTFTKMLFDALQLYLDTYFYALNLGVG